MFEKLEPQPITKENKIKWTKTKKFIARLFEYKNWLGRLNSLFAFGDWIDSVEPIVLTNKRIRYMLGTEEHYDEWKAISPRDYRLIVYHWINALCSGKSNAIDYIELGVFQGKSIRNWAHINKNLESRFFGFDSFKGLPDDWDRQKAGDFNMNGIPPTFADPRIRIHVGLIQDTLPKFVESFTPMNDHLVIHMDVDLFSSTLAGLAIFIRSAPYPDCIANMLSLLLIPQP